MKFYVLFIKHKTNPILRQTYLRNTQQTRDRSQTADNRQTEDTGEK